MRCWLAGSRSPTIGVTSAACRECPGDTVVRSLTHVPLGSRPTILAVRVRRYRCGGCGHVWRQNTDAAAAPWVKLSRHAVLWALKSMVVDRLSIARVAGNLGASWHTVNDAVLCAWPGSRRRTSRRSRAPSGRLEQNDDGCDLDVGPLSTVRPVMMMMEIAAQVRCDVARLVASGCVRARTVFLLITRALIGHVSRSRSRSCLSTLGSRQRPRRGLVPTRSASRSAPGASARAP